MCKEKGFKEIEKKDNMSIMMLEFYLEDSKYKKIHKIDEEK